MTHYNVSKKTEQGIDQPNNWQIIRIDQLIFDKGMIAKAKKEGLLLKKITVFPKTNSKWNSLPLNKWDQVEQVFLSKKELYPIKIRFYTKIAEKDYYEVIDGRHRTLASLRLGYEYIPSIIIE